MLWTAIAAVMNTPRSSPPAYDTPTPTPSLNECTVITATIRTAVRASAPRNAPTIKFSLRGIA